MSASMLDLDSDQESYNYAETLGKPSKRLNKLNDYYIQQTLFLQTPL